MFIQLLKKLCCSQVLPNVPARYNYHYRYGYHYRYHNHYRYIKLTFIVRLVYPLPLP